MGFMDKLKTTFEGLSGKGKEATGKARGDRSQEFEGKADQAKADVKDLGHNVKDAADPDK